MAHFQRIEIVDSRGRNEKGHRPNLWDGGLLTMSSSTIRNMGRHGSHVATLVTSPNAERDHVNWHLLASGLFGFAAAVGNGTNRWLFRLHEPPLED